MEALEREGSASPSSLKISEDNINPTEPPPFSLTEEIQSGQEPEKQVALLVNDSKPSENLLVELDTPDGAAKDVQESLSGLQRLLVSIQNRFSQSQVLVRQVDLTTLALEGVAAGMVMTVGFLMLLRPR